MISKEQTKELRKCILNDNKILYKMHKHPMTETCMCWGLEVPDVWLNEIESLSKKLEAMNALVYPKHRVRIQADQVKDKFATLRFYYSIVVDPPKWICAYESLMEKFFNFIAKLDYKLVRIVDREAYDDVITKKILYDDVEKEIELCKNMSNVEIVDDPDGKNGKIKRTIVHYPQKVHYEPTQFKLLHKLLKSKQDVVNAIRKISRWESSYEQKCICELVDNYASNMVEASTVELEHTCEKCGTRINESYSPLCVTYGWISYLCDKCADESKMPYKKNGEVWKAGQKIRDCKKDELNEDAK